jgi:DnaJ-domain-containing protein 1
MLWSALLQRVFYVAKNYYSLERILRAKNNKEIGLALGYPINAVKSYLKNIDGEIRNWNYFIVSIAKARSAGKEIPKWLAYISFVPENLNILNNKVSEEARMIGKKYRNFVKKNNPELAKKVEDKFFNMILPDSWEKDSEGNYKLCYKINLDFNEK